MMPAWLSLVGRGGMRPARPVQRTPCACVARRDAPPAGPGPRRCAVIPPAGMRPRAVAPRIMDAAHRSPGGARRLFKLSDGASRAILLFESPVIWVPPMWRALCLGGRTKARQRWYPTPRRRRGRADSPRWSDDC